jgi:hypothetical protein
MVPASTGLQLIMQTRQPSWLLSLPQTTLLVSQNSSMS